MSKIFREDKIFIAGANGMAGRAIKKNFIKNVKTGDRVVTKSGMHGKIVEINDSNNTCVLVTMAGKIKFDKSAISFELSESLSKKD